MSYLGNLDIGKYFNGRSIDYFVETGTYHGASVTHALKFPFKKCFSIEILKGNYDICMGVFKDNPKVELILGSSIDGLKQLISNGKINGSCLFWLDAHLPNFYDGSWGDDYLGKKDIFIPLESELNIIAQKDISKDVILIDDLRIFERGPFQNGEFHEVLGRGIFQKGIDFVFNILGKTHNVTRSYKDDGYIICEPKLL